MYGEHSIRKVWKSNLKANLKRRLFVATVEYVLLYGSERDLDKYRHAGKIFKWLLHFYAENGSKCQLAKT